MPLHILRQSIVNMRIDAVVKVLDPALPKGGGVRGALRRVALALRRSAPREPSMPLHPGDACLSPMPDSFAKYVIHTVGPVYRGGKRRVDGQLSLCYLNSLKCAAQYRCQSVAFPLIGSEAHGYPKEQARPVAIQAIEHFLLTHDMEVFLCVPDGETLASRKKLLDKVSGYLKAHYREEYWGPPSAAARPSRLARIAAREALPYEATAAKVGAGAKARKTEDTAAPKASADLDALWSDVADQAYAPPPSLESEVRSAYPAMMPEASVAGLQRRISNLDEPFSSALLRLIDAKGKTDVEVYKRANLDRKLFSKIRKGMGYTPSKRTAIALAVALELSLEEMDALLMRAGYALSHSQKFDVIVEYFILNRQYDIFEINEVLFQYDQPLLGG